MSSSVDNVEPPHQSDSTDIDARERSVEGNRLVPVTPAAREAFLVPLEYAPEHRTGRSSRMACRKDCSVDLPALGSQSIAFEHTVARQAKVPIRQRGRSGKPPEALAGRFQFHSLPPVPRHPVSVEQKLSCTVRRSDDSVLGTRSADLLRRL